MDWILDNLQLIIVIAGAIAYWLNQRAREKAGQEADYDEDGIPENRSPMERAEPPLKRAGFDTDQEERARRIREEIQRKIAERRGQAAPPPMPAPPPLDPFRPVFREEAAPVPPPLRRAEAPPLPPPPLPSVTISAEEEHATLDRQRRLAEEFERLEEQRQAARRVAAEARGATITASSSAAASGAGPLIGSRGVAAELRDPRALRRAFVLREVLSAPVALR